MLVNAWNSQKLELAPWANARWPHEYLSMIDVYRQPLAHSRLIWTREERQERNKMGTSKDGRDENSMSVGQLKSVMGLLIELKAVKEAFFIFIASIWEDRCRLIINSNSSNVTKWIQEPVTTPWRMRKCLLQIEKLMADLPSLEIRHIKSEANQRADSLAKNGAQQ
ncbi:Uncharacterized protein TCM_001153 [Theobroma cacao]|uniref:RNase H type-1 domain-containing protein n=1 Tax=Theobroma cacao TaxID=3641 RepID=A0A061DQH2_THECC|nr:Uncharacterized protein TCM_001153 [Theobroma cacao]